ncbi:MAG: FAD-dependent oxidoreductase, partial [Bacteroidota bacterium]
MPYRPSYWEQQTFLRPTDVLIIGAGLTGLQAARELKRRAPTLDVTLVERAPIPRGASTRNAGFACFGGPTELLADLDAYGEEATLATVRKRYAGIRALENNFAGRGIDWAKHGGYELVDVPEKVALVLQRLPELNRLLREVTGLPETWSVVKATPFSDDTLLLRNPLEGQLHPGKLVECLLEDLRTAGVRVLSGVAVMGVLGGAAAGARLAEYGFLRASRVLVTVNAFVRQLLPDEFSNEVRPVRNQVLLSRLLPGMPLAGCYHYHEGYVYFRNVGPRRLLIGGARHVAGAMSET